LNREEIMSKSSIESKKAAVLIIDDEIAVNENDREDCLLDIGVQPELAYFASNYEEAIKILQKDSNIVICFVDYKIPKNKIDKYNFEEKNDAWGLSLIPQINSINKQATIVVYSSYVDKSYLQNEALKFEGIVAEFYGKPEGIQYRKKLYESALKKRSSFNYQELDEQTELFVREKTQQLKTLIKRTTQDILDIGKYLSEIKQTLEHGQFTAWVKAELDFSYESAWRFMSTYEKFKNFNLKDLNFSHVTALYELSDPEIPQVELNQLVEASVRSGEAITRTTALNLKNKYKKTRKQIEKTLLKTKESDSNATEAQSNDSDVQDLPLLLEDSSSRGDRETVDSEISPKIINATDLETTKNEIVKLIPRPKIWSLGPKLEHTIFALDPNSQDFIKRLPLKISLCLAFPTVKNWQPRFEHYESITNFHSQYQDLDHLMLMESIDRIVQITTESDNNVVVCYIPHPAILSLIHQLGCRAYIADPKYENCLDLIEFFQKTNR
jgi:hypothetical protein